MSQRFAARTSIEQVEEGKELAPKFDAHGLIPAVTTDATSGELLMVGYMNADALARTIETGEAHYWSRTRRALWHKGATSGLVQTVKELLIDDDQDCVWLKVDVAGGRAATSAIARASTGGFRSARPRGLSSSPSRKRSSTRRRSTATRRTRRSCSGPRAVDEPRPRCARAPRSLRSRNKAPRSTPPSPPWRRSARR